MSWRLDVVAELVAVAPMLESVDLHMMDGVVELHSQDVVVQLDRNILVVLVSLVEMPIGAGDD